MQTVIRTDANHTIGVGHFTRCLTLARELNDTGHEVNFQSRCEIPELIQQADEFGIVVTELQNDESLPESTFLSVEAQQDWAVIDGYHFKTAHYQAALKIADNLLVIDDKPRHTEYPANLLVDQNYGAENHRYPLPDNAQLLGTSYALIRPEILALRDKSRSRTRSNIDSIVVTFGGSDPAHATGQVVTALSAVELTDLHVNVIAGPANSDIPRLQQLCDAAGFILHVNPSNMPYILSTSDLAISGAGTTIWELMCLGVPIISLTIAENQIPAARSLEKDGLIGYLGQSTDLSTKDLASNITDLLGVPDKLERMAKSSSEKIDGQGTSRVIAGMAKLTNNNAGDGE
jgi:UDP-2,4-diacetamido-2,4,6-trideoxy-beta-L-altropyranose hydrolase